MFSYSGIWSFEGALGNVLIEQFTLGDLLENSNKKI